MNRPLISVVSPEYRGARMVHELVERCTQVMSTITDNFEIILVNDSSPDDTWDEICKECLHDERVKGINLSRNFGQHYAISAGLAEASGDWLVVMDCDLQDNPSVIPAMLEKAMSGFDYIQVRRVNKKFGFFKRCSSLIFHRILSWMSGSVTDPGIGNFCMMSRQVVNEINRMPENIRSLGTLLRYVGFHGTVIDVEHSERAEGTSSYTLGKLLKHASDVIVANSNKPLKVAVVVGFVISAISFALALYNVIAKLCGIITLQGYTTTVFSIWFVGGLILLMLGIIGLYLGKVFDQVKGRQIYIVKDKINFKQRND